MATEAKNAVRRGSSEHAVYVLYKKKNLILNGKKGFVCQPVNARDRHVLGCRESTKTSMAERFVKKKKQQQKK
jgi:hypothetical protein